MSNEEVELMSGSEIDALMGGVKPEALSPDPKDDAEDMPDPAQPEPSEEATTDNEDTPTPVVKDEYGNDAPVEKEKLYTQDEVNERINKAVRERLERMERNQAAQQPTQSQQQSQAAAEGDDWESQLRQFVRNEHATYLQEQQQHAQAMREQLLQQQFEQKLVSGMGRFNDFHEVVSAQPITDAMTTALRGVTDPAAFIYAASKRHGAELERIAKIPDAYSQMVEMGKLEERMKKSKATTSAPRPASKEGEDMARVTPKEVPTRIEDLIAESEARIRSRRAARR